MFCWYWWNWWPSLFKLSFHNVCLDKQKSISNNSKYCLFVCLMVFNATFNNISVTCTGISWRSVLLVDETGGPGENHWLVANHWQTWSHNVVYLPWSRFKLTTSVVIGTDCIGSCKFNYHTITTTMAPILQNKNYIEYIYCIWRISPYYFLTAILHSREYHHIIFLKQYSRIKSWSWQLITLNTIFTYLQETSSQIKLWRDVNTARGCLAILAWIVLSITSTTDRLGQMLKEGDDFIIGDTVELANPV